MPCNKTASVYYLLERQTDTKAGKLLTANACNPALERHFVIFPIVFTRWQHYIWWRFALFSNGKEFFNPILDPDNDPDHHPKKSLALLIAGARQN